MEWVWAHFSLHQSRDGGPKTHAHDPLISDKAIKARSFVFLFFIMSSSNSTRNEALHLQRFLVVG